MEGLAALDLGFPVVQGNQDLQDFLMQYAEFGLDSSLVD
jgi:hypothetical protein